MENFGGYGFSAGACIVRRKRSIASHRPWLDPLTLSERSTIFPPFGQIIGKEFVGKNQGSNEKVVHSDGLGSGNGPKKLKLKLRGITHTIQTKHSADDLTPQSTPLLQDDGGKRIGVKQNSISRNEHSSKGKISGRSVPEDDELAPKSKRLSKRRVLDVGLSEDGDGDEEIRFLKRLNASKVGHSDRSQVDDDYRGDEIGNFKEPRGRNGSRKRSRSDKLYVDDDYMGEEEEMTSDDELESHGRKMKKGSLSLLLERPKDSTPTTRYRALQSGSSVVDLPNTYLPALPKKKKDQISDVEKQSKKAEAAQRRKIQSEKIAREAEDEAIRKILGQDSKKKKKEEELKQKRDQLTQGRNASAVTLGPNTVRWVNGPKGTTVTFSEDIGLPSIFSPVPCSYPPPREKCAGPNCTNTYKYRDSKSKLPLCSLLCYKALNRETQPLVTC